MVTIRTAANARSAPLTGQDAGFRVTVEDLTTGDKQAMICAPGDMMVIPFAPCYKASSQHHANGTTIITLKDHRPQFEARPVGDQIEWRSLEHAPVAGLRAELASRVPETEHVSTEHDRFADLLAISYELDLGDDRDQDMGSNIRQLIVVDDMHAAGVDHA